MNWTDSQKERAYRRRRLISEAFQSVAKTIERFPPDPSGMELECANLRGLISELDLEVFRIFGMMNDFRNELWSREREARAESDPPKRISVSCAEIEELLK